MTVFNKDIADVLNRVADLLEIRDENPFRVRAYRNAARTVAGLQKSIAGMIGSGDDLTELPNIGSDLEGKIKKIVETGTLDLLDDLQKKLPSDLSGIMRLGGLGPKRVKTLFRELGIQSFEDLRHAAEQHLIRELEGFGEKTEKKILDETGARKQRQSRIRLVNAEEIAADLIGYLKQLHGVKKAEAAGSYRRRRDTVGDLDILAACTRGTEIMEHFSGYENVEQVLSKGKTRSAVILNNGLQVDLRVVSTICYGAALHYFTGSKEHNISVRKRAAGKNLKINEYGVFRGDTRIAGKTEQEVYHTVDLPYIEPELRENRGEIEAAERGCLPRLVSPGHIRGDLHVHTSQTDGRNSIQQMAAAAQSKGYDYLAVTDHSQSLTVAQGLDVKRLRRQIEEIDRLNDTLNGFTLLKGIEVDILENGDLDLPDEVLKELDLTICSVHSKFGLSREKQTKRVVRAMDNPYFSIFGHPTGRLIGEREGYDIDMESIVNAAGDRGCLLEVNSHPERLDLDDNLCKAAKDAGVLVAVSTDAHSIEGLDHIRYGIDQARRGWIEPADVVNTRGLHDLKARIKRS